MSHTARQPAQSAILRYKSVWSNRGGGQNIFISNLALQTVLNLLITIIKESSKP